MWDENGKRDEDAFEIMHDAIRWSLDNDLLVVIDLHILRSHHFNAEEKPLWTEPAEQERFFDLWRDLSEALHEYPVEKVVYELMNEPVADDPDDWNRLAARAFAAVRELRCRPGETWDRRWRLYGGDTAGCEVGALGRRGLDSGRLGHGPLRLRAGNALERRPRGRWRVRSCGPVLWLHRRLCR